MAEPRIIRAALGFPVWTIGQVGETVLVVIDHDCPEDEAAVTAAVTRMLQDTTNIVGCFDGPSHNDGERSSADDDREPGR